MRQVGVQYASWRSLSTRAPTYNTFLTRKSGFDATFLSARVQVVSLFSGIGGLELGLGRAGFETMLFAENDPVASNVLAKRFPSIENVGDVRTLSEIPGKPDLVTAGFPCQNLSMVGDKTGIRGSKSGVVDQLFRLLEKSRPPRVLIENVTFMLRLDRGEAMNTLVERLEGLGYNWAYRVLDSRWFGVPQRRRRVYLLATLGSAPEATLLGDRGEVVEELRWDLDWQSRPLGFYWTEGFSGVGFVPDGLPTIKSGSGVGIASPPAAMFPDGSIKIPTIVAAEILQGFPQDWTDVADINQRLRWRLVGNAVTSNVAEWLGRRLQANAGDSTIEGQIAFDLHRGWPSAAWGGGGKRYTAKISHRPANSETAKLSHFPHLGWTALSKRAAEGFLSRAKASTLRFPDGFVDSVARYCAAA